MYESQHNQQVLHKAPVGFFIAWVQAGRDITGTAEEKLTAHRLMRKSFAHGGAVDYASRLRGRARAQCDPDLDSLMLWEATALSATGLVVEPNVQS
jgi:hypothetical protein